MGSSLLGSVYRHSRCGLPERALTTTPGSQTWLGPGSGHPTNGAENGSIPRQRECTEHMVPPGLSPYPHVTRPLDSSGITLTKDIFKLGPQFPRTSGVFYFPEKYSDFPVSILNVYFI